MLQESKVIYNIPVRVTDTLYSIFLTIVTEYCNIIDTTKARALNLGGSGALAFTPTPLARGME
jgi:hypothetical protein